MGRFFDPEVLIQFRNSAETWLYDQVLVPSTLVQLAALMLVFAVARFLAPKLAKLVESAGKVRRFDHWLGLVAAAIARLAFAIVWLALCWLMALVAAGRGWPHHLITIAVSLLSAWIVINLISSLIRNRTFSRAVAIVAWTIAALNILELLDPAITLLDSAAVNFGDVRISALTVVEGVLALTVLMWAAVALGDLLERRIRHSPNLTPSVQVLFAKLLKVVLFAIAILIALESVGVDLTAFTVFTGALGVGIGFGLQKTVSNLISGVLILMDKSIKPGDVIEVSDTYGWVNSLGSRYVSVITRDGVEHLIPNEDLITQRVTNWSFSGQNVRLKAPLGISYDADVRRAVELCIEAAGEVERVLADPKPVCHVRGFGDSSVDLEIRFWINDPRNGVSNVRSQVYLKVWDKFHEHGIEIPYPQRDLHIKSPVPVTVSQG